MSKTYKKYSNHNGQTIQKTRRPRIHSREDARYLCATCTGGVVKPHRWHMGETQCEGCKVTDADTRLHRFAGPKQMELNLG